MGNRNDEVERFKRLRDQQLRARDPQKKQQQLQHNISKRYKQSREPFSFTKIWQEVEHKWRGILIGGFLGFILLIIRIFCPHIILVIPGIHIDTSRAYSRIMPSIPEERLSDLIQLPVDKWKNRVRNDFEEIVYHDHREIADIQDKLYSSGAVFSSLSGSGSAVYGIFTRDTGVPDFPPDYFTWSGQL